MQRECKRLAKPWQEGFYKWIRWWIRKLLEWIQHGLSLHHSPTDTASYLPHDTPWCCLWFIRLFLQRYGCVRLSKSLSIQSGKYFQEVVLSEIERAPLHISSFTCRHFVRGCANLRPEDLPQSHIFTGKNMRRVFSYNHSLVRRRGPGIKFNCAPQPVRTSCSISGVESSTPSSHRRSRMAFVLLPRPPKRWLRPHQGLFHAGPCRCLHSLWDSSVWKWPKIRLSNVVRQGADDGLDIGAEPWAWRSCSRTTESIYDASGDCGPRGA